MAEFVAGGDNAHNRKTVCGRFRKKLGKQRHIVRAQQLPRARKNCALGHISPGSQNVFTLRARGAYGDSLAGRLRGVGGVHSREFLHDYSVRTLRKRTARVHPPRFAPVQPFKRYGAWAAFAGKHKKNRRSR